MHPTKQIAIRPRMASRIQTSGFVFLGAICGGGPAATGDIWGGDICGAPGWAATWAALTGVPQVSQNAPFTWAPHDVQKAIDHLRVILPSVILATRLAT